MGEQHDGVVVAGAELHPPAGPRIQVTPLRDKSRLPITRRRRNQYHPAALRGLLYRREARSRHHPRRDSRDSKLRLPAPAAWSWKRQRYSSLGPPRPRVSRASQTSRQARDPPVLDAETKTRCRAQARPARHLVRSCLDDERVRGHRPTHRRARPRQYLGQVGSSLRANQIALPNAQHRPVRRIGRCHFSVPNTWTASTVPGRDGRGIREKPHEPVGKAAMSAARLTARRAGARSRPRPRSARASVSRRRRCCKLLFESTEESLATSTTPVVVRSRTPRAASPVTCSTPTRGLGTGDISQIGR